MDRVGASYERTIETMRRRLRANAIPVQLPLGEEDEFRGVIDLIGGRALVYQNNDGKVSLTPPEEMPVPEDEMSQYNEYRQAMIEKILSLIHI